MSFTRVEASLDWTGEWDTIQNFIMVSQELYKVLAVRLVPIGTILDVMDFTLKGVTSENLFVGTDSDVLSPQKQKLYAFLVDSLGTGNFYIHGIVERSFAGMGMNFYTKYILDGPELIHFNSFRGYPIRRPITDDDRIVEQAKEAREAEYIQPLSRHAQEILRNVRKNPSAHGTAYRAHQVNGATLQKRRTKKELAKAIEESGVDWQRDLIFKPRNQRRESDGDD